MPSFNLFPAKADDSQNNDTRLLIELPDSITEDRVSSVLTPDPAMRRSKQNSQSPTLVTAPKFYQAPSDPAEDSLPTPEGTVSTSD